MVSKELLKNNFPIVVLVLLVIPVLIAIMALCIKINNTLTTTDSIPLGKHTTKSNSSSQGGTCPAAKKPPSDPASPEEQMNDNITVAKITNMTSLVISAVLLLSFFCIFLCSLKK